MLMGLALDWIRSYSAIYRLVIDNLKNQVWNPTDCVMLLILTKLSFVRLCCVVPTGSWLGSLLLK